jgi:hypothetical protein
MSGLAQFSYPFQFREHDPFVMHAYVDSPIESSVHVQSGVVYDCRATGSMWCNAVHPEADPIDKKLLFPTSTKPQMAPALKGEPRVGGFSVEAVTLILIERK